MESAARFATGPPGSAEVAAAQVRGFYFFFDFGSLFEQTPSFPHALSLSFLFLLPVHKNERRRQQPRLSQEVSRGRGSRRFKCSSNNRGSYSNTRGFTSGEEAGSSSSNRCRRRRGLLRITSTLKPRVPSPSPSPHPSVPHPAEPPLSI